MNEREKALLSEATNPHWYLVQARPRQAALAVEHLERQGYCVFHPRLRVERLRRGRPVMVEQALFPDYLFIRLQAGVDNFGPVHSTRGVAQLVGFGNVPVPFDAALVEGLRRHLAAPAAGAPGGRGEADSAPGGPGEDSAPGGPGEVDSAPGGPGEADSALGVPGEADSALGGPGEAAPAGTMRREAEAGGAVRLEAEAGGTPAPDPGVAALLGLAEPRERIRALMGLVSPSRGRVRALIGAGESAAGAGSGADRGW